MLEKSERADRAAGLGRDFRRRKGPVAEVVRSRRHIVWMSFGQSLAETAKSQFGAAPFAPVARHRSPAAQPQSGAQAHALQTLARRRSSAALSAADGFGRLALRSLRRVAASVAGRPQDRQGAGLRCFPIHPTGAKAEAGWFAPHQRGRVAPQEPALAPGRAGHSRAGYRQQLLLPEKYLHPNPARLQRLSLGLGPPPRSDLPTTRRSCTATQPGLPAKRRGPIYHRSIALGPAAQSVCENEV